MTGTHTTDDSSDVADGMLTRRRLLAGAAAVAALRGTRVGHTPTDRSVRRGSRTPVLAVDPYTLGVASGDPLADRVILWTRLAPEPFAGGLCGMPDEAVDVTWEIATDDTFATIVSHGVASAEPANAHSLHVDADGLEPRSDYFYRFTVGPWTSRIGRTRTAAAAGTTLDRLTLAVANCQSFQDGFYAAYRHMLDEELDLVVHLGDYIYEGVPDPAQRCQVHPANEPKTLDEYRLRYASYKSDPDLLAAHARYPFMTMWDDHEVANDYNGDVVGSERRAAAYRAYWEHLPVRAGPPDGPEMTLYRDAVFGDLARLYLLDERQYTDRVPCADVPIPGFGDCPERQADRVHLGDEQHAWIDRQLARGGVRWNLFGSPTFLTGANNGDEQTAYYYLETWDGYAHDRRRFVERLADPAVANPVVLCGDWHAGAVADVHLDPDDYDSRVVASELMAVPISSALFGLPTAQNPHIRHAIQGHGYLKVTVEPESLTAEFRVLGDVTTSESKIATESAWRIDTGGITANRV